MNSRSAKSDVVNLGRVPDVAPPRRNGVLLAAAVLLETGWIVLLTVLAFVR